MYKNFKVGDGLIITNKTCESFMMKHDVQIREDIINNPCTVLTIDDNQFRVLFDRDLPNTPLSKTVKGDHRFLGLYKKINTQLEFDFQEGGSFD